MFEILCHLELTSTRARKGTQHVVLKDVISDKIDIIVNKWKNGTYIATYQYWSWNLELFDYVSRVFGIFLRLYVVGAHKLLISALPTRPKHTPFHQMKWFDWDLDSSSVFSLEPLLSMEKSCHKDPLDDFVHDDDETQKDDDTDLQSGMNLTDTDAHENHVPCDIFDSYVVDETKVSSLLTVIGQSSLLTKQPRRDKAQHLSDH